MYLACSWHHQPRPPDLTVKNALAEGLVSSYPRKLTQSITVTTPSSLNPFGSSSRICSASVAGKAEPLYSERARLRCIEGGNYLDSTIIRSGLYFSRISTRAFSIRPTMVQHKQPLRISETPVMLDCEASSESTIDQLEPL